GAPVVVELHGPSGAGKSTVARRFLRDAQADGAVVLAGQCYEQSAVPYKALDSLVGALCRYLRKLPREKVDALLPVHLGELARLFPVFGRLEAVAEAAPARADDPHEVRRRAPAALPALLPRMARRAPGGPVGGRPAGGRRGARRPAPRRRPPAGRPAGSIPCRVSPR